MARFIRSMIMATALTMAGAVAGQAEESANICDALAGSPQDIDLPAGVTGKSFSDLDPNEAIEEVCLAAAAAQPSNRRFYTHLGRIYAKRGEYLRAIDAYRTANSRGSAVAANNIAAMFISGQGVAVDEARGTRYVRKAAHRGLTHAMVTLATRARLGRGMHANNQIAVYWYEKAYDAGNALAANDLGVMYQNGDGVLAFNAGDADAAAELGRFHAEGLGTVVGHEAAVEWYSRGAAEGSLAATVSLADAYFDGTGVEANPKMAQSLYQLALDLGPNDEWSDYINERAESLAQVE